VGYTNAIPPQIGDFPLTAGFVHPHGALTPATVASCDRATFDEFVRPLYEDDV
jgi:hypothetical protein